VFGIGLTRTSALFGGGGSIDARNTALINNAINATTLEGPRGNTYHGFINITALGNLSARMPTRGARARRQPLEQGAKQPELLQRRRLPGCSAAGPVLLRNQELPRVSALFAPKILQVFRAPT